MPLADVVRGTEQCPVGGPVGAADEQRGAPLAPDDDAALLPQEQRERVADARRDVDQLTGAVLAPSAAAEATKARLLRAAFRAESQAWREPGDGARLARLLQDDVDDLLGKVALLTGPVTLTSSRGQVTVDVENQLDQAVTVRVQIVADNAARLDVAAAGAQTVPPRTSVPLSLQAEPRTSGQFPVRARLLDRRGEPFGAPSEFVLRSTRYGSVALAVTGVGAGVLLVAAGYRLFRAGGRPVTLRLLGSARGMAVGTVASRATGFLRTASLAAVIGVASVGGLYDLANTTPNIVYELLLGGILTSTVVPLLVRVRPGRPGRGRRLRAAAAHPRAARARDRHRGARRGRPAGRRPLHPEHAVGRRPPAGDHADPVLPAADALLRGRGGPRARCSTPAAGSPSRCGRRC